VRSPPPLQLHGDCLELFQMDQQLLDSSVFYRRGNRIKDVIMSDHDCYEHEGGGANLVLADRSLTYFYASLLRLRSLVLL
jgi:hypothetical protein